MIYGYPKMIYGYPKLIYGYPKCPYMVIFQCLVTNNDASLGRLYGRLRFSQAYSVPSEKINDKNMHLAFQQERPIGCL